MARCKECGGKVRRTYPFGKGSKPRYTHSCSLEDLAKNRLIMARFFKKLKTQETKPNDRTRR